MNHLELLTWDWEGRRHGLVLGPTTSEWKGSPCNMTYAALLLPCG